MDVARAAVDFHEIMSETVAGEPLLAGVASRPSRRWIESARFDLLFFILSPVVMLPLAVLAYRQSPRVTFFGVLLGFPHYLSSIAFYFWDERRDYYRARWLAFYAGPVKFG